MTSKLITIKYTLTDQEKKSILREGVGASSRSANLTIAKALIESLEAGVTLPEDRKTFAAQMFKKNVSAKIANNYRARRAKMEMADNYVHYRIIHTVYILELSRQNPRYAEIYGIL
jgi:hypothetical protein